jgi:hypothetical protein
MEGEDKESCRVGSVDNVEKEGRREPRLLERARRSCLLYMYSAISPTSCWGRYLGTLHTSHDSPIPQSHQIGFAFLRCLRGRLFMGTSRETRLKLTLHWQSFVNVGDSVVLVSWSTAEWSATVASCTVVVRSTCSSSGWDRGLPTTSRPHALETSLPLQLADDWNAGHEQQRIGSRLRTFMSWTLLSRLYCVASNEGQAACHIEMRSIGQGEKNDEELEISSIIPL